MTFTPTSPLIIDGLPKFLSMGYHRLLDRATYTFAELGLADRLVNALPNQGLTAHDLINNDEIEWNADILHRALCACTDVGLVERVKNTIDDKHFILTSSGRMLTSDHPSHARDYVRYYLGPMSSNIGYQLIKLVRGQCKGTGFAEASGGLDLYTYLKQPENQDYLRLYNGVMTCLSTYTGDKLVTGVDFGRFETLVDLGGSRGTFLAEILQHYPNIRRGFIFDLPQCIAEVKSADEFESRQITSSRYTFVAGDMTDSSTIPQADAYILKYILHLFNDEICMNVLSSIRKANEQRTDTLLTIFIVEHIIFSDGTIGNWQAHGFDIGMTAYGGARERTEQEYQVLLEKAGFQIKKLYPIQAPDSIIEAIFIK
ncbi:unnamed protein product [Adineta steineri]|uniref:Acetylserotonin O-methyltransferase n=1 Tax=Adineta steineri TaxID=433720 RepID=A0A818M0E6_9BILA|nr:unnamed protein product [Adineta steineri]CAF3584824.1 unnamed protein product [Adineta steineri]